LIAKPAEIDAARENELIARAVAEGLLSPRPAAPHHVVVPAARKRPFPGLWFGLVAAFAVVRRRGRPAALPAADRKHPSRGSDPTAVDRRFDWAEANLREADVILENSGVDSGRPLRRVCRKSLDMTESDGL
jgi:hypothetical protein